MAKLLIAGATGLIGSELACQARAAGHDLTFLVRHQVTGERCIVADLSQPQTLAERLPDERYSAIFYLAQAAEHHAFPTNALATVALNIATPVALCHWAVRTGCDQFIYASSGGVCGPSTSANDRISETWPRQGAETLTFYLSTKARCEELLLSFSPMVRVDLLRYFFVYGPGQRAGFLFPRLAAKVRSGEPIELAAGTGPLLNPVHARDAAALTLATLGKDGEAITNVAGLEDTNLAEIVRTMEFNIGRPAIIAATAGTAPVYLAANERMKARLGVPRIRLAQGLPTSLKAQG